MAEVDVVVEALRHEASAVWDAQGPAIAGVASLVEGLRLGRLTAGVFQLIVGPHEEAVDQIAARCREGGTAMADIAERLRRNAQAYEDADLDVSERLTGAY